MSLEHKCVEAFKGKSCQLIHVLKLKLLFFDYNENNLCLDLDIKH